MKYIEKSLIIQLGNKGTLENIVSEYECVAEVLGYDLFKKIFIELTDRTCKMFNIYDDHVYDFVDYIRFRLGINEDPDSLD